MNRKSRGLWVGLSLLVVASTGCGLGLDLRGNGNLVQEERQTADFVALEVNDGIDVIVLVDAARPRAVRVVGDDNLLARLLTEVEGGKTLHVYFPKTELMHWSSANPLRVEVTVPSLEALSRSGGGTVDVSGSITAESFALAASGGGTVRIGGLDTDSLSMDVSGGADVTLAGSASRVTSTLSGGSTLQARELAVREATLNSSGGCSTVMRVSDSLRVTASGGADLRISGRPTVLSQDLSGGSTLSFE
ncbi:head GIN domain-containing protein [Melittangium boletus]|uniref:Putative auto-transporter adhesin head GIN domain-containing protein n=1 Tax=Melittangium boletus DSM 14713 TaxID=1294270 RepID=A0A250IP12_9BACT|nr:head GIN domain-containing protein [Melittangium boletus]ATB32676.1 hypothetical protein MEBOL_006165 [Melittangium boletus DSM 14713]